MCIRLLFQCLSFFVQKCSWLGFVRRCVRVLRKEVLASESSPDLLALRSGPPVISPCWCQQWASRHVRGSVPHRRKRVLTQLVTLCWKVTTRGSRVQPSLLSCLHAFPTNTPNTPLLHYDIIAHSLRVWRRIYPLMVAELDLNACLCSEQKSKTTTRFHQSCLIWLFQLKTQKQREWWALL